jgi:hypothetical protein
MQNEPLDQDKKNLDVIQIGLVTLKLVAKYHTGHPQTETIATQYHASDIYHLHKSGQVVSFEELIIRRCQSG